MTPTAKLEREWQRTTTRRVVVWLFSRRGARALAKCAAALAILVLLFYAVEDWRGWRAWQRCKRELEAKGLKVEFRAFIPPPVPDERNFAMTPLFRELDFTPRPFREPGLGAPIEDAEPTGRLAQVFVGLPGRWTGRSQAQPPPLGSLHTNGLINLKAWQDFYRGNTNYPNAPGEQTPAQDVLTALSRFDADLKELQQVAGRPYSRFPICYDTEDPGQIPLPHLDAIRRVVRLLQFRSTARLEAGQPQESFADLRLAFRLEGVLKEEPFLISHLVRESVLLLILQGVQEGLARQAWNGAQLTELEQRLASVDLLAGLQRAMEGELATLTAVLEHYRRQGFFGQAGSCSAPLSFVFGRWASLARLAPSGWYHQNKVTLYRWCEQFLWDNVDAKSQRLFSEKLEESEAFFAEIKRTPFNVGARLVFVAPARTCLRTARDQTAVNHARIACALERHRLAHGSFPDTLGALVPQFIAKLPHDLINGEPLKYRRTEDGGYLLYSVGWDGKDDGGKIVSTHAKHPDVDSWHGDWVWRQSIHKLLVILLDYRLARGQNSRHAKRIVDARPLAAARRCDWAPRLDPGPSAVESQTPGPRTV